LTWRNVAAGGDPTVNEQSDIVDLSIFHPNRRLVGRAVGKARKLLRSTGYAPNKASMIVRGVQSALGRFPIEIIEMEEAFGLPSRVAALDRVPVVTRLHGPWFLNGEVLGAAKDADFARRVEWERQSIMHADAVTAPSQDVLDRTRAFYDVPLEEAIVIPYPLGAGELDPPWSLAGCDRNRIAFIGRFDRHKGADVVIDAFARLAARRSELQLDFVGPDRGVANGSGQVAFLAGYLDGRIADAGIRRRIRVHGQLPPHEANEIRRRAFLTVVPSRYETFGYTAIEAMSLGCPLIASESGGLAEIVRSGETGLGFRSGDAESLATQIERLLDDPPLASRLGAAARADVARRYLPRTIAEATLDFYASVSERWQARRRGPATAGRPNA
jgi:glycosyltransferase involved in cell wall biosynthesis